MSQRPKPLALLIMGGFGYRKESGPNAIAQQNNPALDKICNALTAENFKRAFNAMLRNNTQILLTADQSNIELAANKRSVQLHTASTTNLMPFVFIGCKQGVSLKSSGALSDIAPTLLDTLRLPQPVGLTSQALLISS
ncbi:MAG: hypothetical protein ABL903_08070 [Methylococcales bacterium]